MNVVNFNHYSQGNYSPGANIWLQMLWYFLGAPLVRSYWLPWSGLKVMILRWFGAKIGAQVRIKPGVRIKFPWRLCVGDYVWIGEDAWLDNLAMITIEDHVCISQAAYLCTGNHDWSSPHFDLRVAPILVKEAAWVAARATVGPGVTIETGAILSLGSVACRTLMPMAVSTGNPAQPIKPRYIKPDSEYCPTQAVNSTTPESTLIK
jgi:putative colanic acid biosynthesis acetyltransferase WcaF